MGTVQSVGGAASVRVEQITPRRSRISSVDAVRGAVMILMAVDHIRDFINVAAMSYLPTDLSRTTAPIFFTRWITHFCAPVFAFTAGMGAFFWMQRRTVAELSRFLITRGVWLMFLEVTVIQFLLFLNVRFVHTIFVLTVLWMLGLSMIVLAVLVHLPSRLLVVLSVAVIATHNIFDHVEAVRLGRAAWLWNVLHQQGGFSVASNTIFVAYPLIPWFAVMACGYSLGLVFMWESGRRRFLLRLGVGLSVAFLVLRGLNVYGDPAPWSVQRTRMFTVLSFLNTTKYPPSLEFLLMTLGPAILAMALLDRARLSPKNPLIVFGRVPFFFFLVHLAVIHALAIGMTFVRYGNASFLLIPPPSMGGSPQAFPPDFGYSLGVVYAVWVAVIVMLYPLCRWYAGLKQRRRDWWLSYL